MTSVWAYLHFIAVGGLAIMVFAQSVVLRGRVDAISLRLLRRLDLGYLIFAMAALASGLARAFLGDKPWAYYAASPFFHAKVGVFVLIGVLSIVPTVRLLRLAKVAAHHDIWMLDSVAQGSLRRWVNVELLLLPLLPLFAVLMARGLPAL